MKFSIQHSAFIIQVFVCFLWKNSPISAQPNQFVVCVEKPFAAPGAGFLKKIGFEVSEFLDGTGPFLPLDAAKISPAAGCHLLTVPFWKMAVRPTKTDTPWNGLTTWDLLIISKYLNGTQPFTSCLQYFAADVNNNKQVTTFDIVELRKVILGQTTLFKTWWFIYQDSSLLTFDGPGGCDGQTVGLLNPAKPTPNFWGIKIGDVNFDFPVDSALAVVDRSRRPTLNLLATDRELQPGDSKIIQFFPEKTGDWLGWQAALLFDENDIEIDEILPETPDGLAAFRTAPGRLAMNWFSGEAQSFSPGGEAFISLKIRALQKIRLSEALHLEVENLPAEAYSADETPFKIELQFLKNGPQKEVAGLSVFPNPFSETVFLKMENPPVGDCFLQIFDRAGRLVFTKKMDGETAEISGEKLGASGSYFFRIADSQAVKTGSFFYQK